MMSEAMCRLTDGSGCARRTLDSEAEGTLFAVARPITFTGIESVATVRPAWIATPLRRDEQ